MADIQDTWNAQHQSVQGHQKLVYKAGRGRGRGGSHLQAKISAEICLYENLLLGGVNRYHIPCTYQEASTETDDLDK